MTEAVTVAVARHLHHLAGKHGMTYIKVVDGIDDYCFGPCLLDVQFIE